MLKLWAVMSNMSYICKANTGSRTNCFFPANPLLSLSPLSCLAYFIFSLIDVHILLCPHMSCGAGHGHFCLESGTVARIMKGTMVWTVHIVHVWAGTFCMCKSCWFYEFDELGIGPVVSSIIFTLSFYTKQYINARTVTVQLYYYCHEHEILNDM